MNAAALSQARLRKVEKPKEPPSLLKEVDSSKPTDLSKLQVVSLSSWRFDPTTGEWGAVQKSDGDAPLPLPKKLRILTFNVWIQQDHMDERMSALMQIVKQRQVDIVAMQEATPKHLQVLHAHPYVRENFYVSGLEGQYSTYKTLIMARLPFHTLSSVDMPYSGRKVTLGTWNFGRSNATQSFALSSKSESNDWKARMAQFAFQDSKVAQYDTTVIAGDFNCVFKREEEIFSSNGYVDVWHRLHPRDPGATFDARMNHHALSTTAPNFAARLDRVALKSKKGWTATKIEIVGQQAIVPNELFISDHWGLLATFRTHS